MKRTISLFLTCLLVAILQHGANAYDFNDKIYGKANIKVGYNFKHYVGSYMGTYLKGYAKQLSEKPSRAMQTRATQHYIALSVGYDFYYKLNDLLHPFAGFEVTGLITVGSRTFATNYLSQLNKRFPTTIQEYFILVQRSGIKVNIAKNTSLLGYSILGLNIVKLDRPIREPHTKSLNRVGITAGAGIEIMFLDKFSFALEYRYARNRSMRQIESFGDPASAYIESNNAMAKFGYYFL